MLNRLTLLGTGVATSAALVLGAPLAANASADWHGGIVQHNLISDQPGKAELTDPLLGNAWGISRGPETSIWVSNPNTSTVTIYRGGVPGTPLTEVKPSISVPGGPPSGQVFNDTKGFEIPGTGQPARFVFAGLAGGITAWNQGTASVQVAHTDTAAYSGLALLHGRSGPQLAAADFHNGRIDLFDSKFHKISTGHRFQDRTIPDGFAPFNIQEVGDRVFVMYAKQDANKAMEVRAPGLGFVDQYRTDGSLVGRLASRGVLNAPFGVTLAPKHFGKYSGKLLVGNLGDGRINVYDVHSGRYDGFLTDTKHQPIALEGLWGLVQGNDTAGGANAVWFASGPGANGEHGLVGTLTAE
nr:TIGR03118 family protein [uncultured Actinoplanes sp.]